MVLQCAQQKLIIIPCYNAFYFVVDKFPGKIFEPFTDEINLSRKTLIVYP